MIDAHAAFLGDPITTDVITSDLSEAGPDGSPGALDVDLIVCIDEADRQAQAHGHTLLDELTLYAVHGLLHSAGHDDHDEHDIRRMRRREAEVLAALGIKDVTAGNMSAGESGDQGADAALAAVRADAQGAR